MNLKVAILILFLSATHVLCSQKLNYREIPLPEAVKTSTLDLLYTDREGFLWLAAGSAVYWYDGLQFNSIITDTTNRYGDRISALYHDSKGTMWLGWKSGYISTISGDSTFAYSPEEGTPSAPIVAWVEDDEGRLWMATNGEGLYVQNTNGRWYNFNYDDGLPSDESYDLVAMGNGVMLASDQGLVRCKIGSDNHKQIELINQEDGLADQIVKKLFKDGDDLWIAFYEQAINRITAEGEIISEKAPPGIDGHMILRSGETTWWLSESGHLFRSTAGRNWQQVEIKDIRGTQIRHLALDNEGHLWVSTNKGLFLFDQWAEHYETISAVTALCLSDSLLWYSQQGNIHRLNLNSGQDKKVWSGVNLILALYADQKQRIWAGTFDGGLVVYDNKSGRTQIFNERSGLANNNVLSIDGNDEGVWLGTLGGVSYFDLTEGVIGRPRSYDHIEGVGVQYIYAVHIDKDGEVYLATDGDGILRRDGNFFRPLSIDLPSNVVLDITSDHQGRLWWITPDGTLHCWKTGEGGEDIPPFKSESGRVAGLQADDTGGILIFHEGGIHRWDPVQKYWTHYGKSFGLGGLQPELHAQSTSGSNLIYTGTAVGITALRLNFLPDKPRASTHLLSRELFFKPSAKQTFGASENHITFNYIGRWYTDPEDVRYKLRLDGYDLDWTISQNTSITYPRLPPGDYTFSVVAGVDGYFPDEEMKSFSFVVSSPWYAKWYVITAAILLLGLISYLIGRMRMRQLQAKQYQEQQRVRAQYEALKSQVNPHFLFNSFNTLMALIEEDRKEATEYLSALSDFFRNILQFREIDLIPVAGELDIVKTYLSLQEKRFGSNLIVTIEVCEEASQTLIPPLTLQLLVENAFKHNVISRARPLKLSIYSENGYIVVWNVLQEKNLRDASTGYGLDSIRKKYDYHSRKEVKVELTDDHFAVYLPLILKT